VIASRQPPRRRTRRVLTLLVAAGLAALAFALGVAVGEALEDNPSPGGSVTRVRTLRPLPLPPARVTVTVSS
jgi:ABC-type molybdate transport system permease subunit